VATLQANLATLRAVAGDPYMHDPQLRGRLAEAAIPTLVIWGDSDRIASAHYGRAYADSFVDARFELVNEAGHLPQIEQPAATFALIDAFSQREG
jgi:pimeloyl-ACP methyl ester carboxylesterase